FEQPALFRNNDLPGIMLASGAQRLIAQFALKPFSRAVVLTANAEGYRAALDLRDAGVEIAAIVDLRTGSEAAAQGAAARAAGIAIVPGSTIYAAKPASGKVGITGVVIRTVDSAAAGERRIACDGVAMSVGWAPSDGLICQVGGKMAYSDPIQQFVPDVMPAGMFAAGRINGFHALDAKLADGARAGDAAAAHAGLFTGPVAKIAERIGPSPTHPLACLSHPDGKVFVDLDEDVQLKDLENAAQEGFDSVELLKRYSTFGMGPSQGKHSNTNTIRVLAKIRGQTMGEIGAPRSRPFYHPITFGHLGGRGFHPHRHTALHQRHVDAHAVFMLAGEWKRPAYYATPGTTRESAISQEARAVRQSLGIIDVGTLGKIEVSGAAAGDFIERIYTGRFAKMKIGTTRYGLMCDESGVIIDDGVIARIAEDRYYVTTTTTASASVYREMQRWALIWGLEVVLVNATGTYAAMNLAGPQSRAVLATLTGQDLAEAAFPYLGAREALVAGVPARLMRVGFVGELGYEIHVPACSGAHVWDALIAAGASVRIRPFGVEAQRILRLEKGHAIISQDTDGLSTPRDAQMEWAVKMDKPFFIGQRSLAIVAEKPAKRTLIGFTLSPHHRGLVPQECHLVVDGRTICGRVTSVVASPTLGHVIGMAYVTPAQAKPGTVIHIRLDSGHQVDATVSATPFYDPKNLRQTEGGPATAEAPAAPPPAATKSMANAGKT
ncbi:MAG: aminomethyltransferase, partial [Planctomycetes bacterium]|nr:aminomethyltransferase [Planctomycetota bacterium]